MMKNSKVIIWDLSFLVAVILFLSTKNWNHYNLIIGLVAVNILRYCIKFHIDFYKIPGKIY